VATIGLAGLCVWIIGWEDDDEDEEGEPEQKQAWFSPASPVFGPGFFPRHLRD
jgi:hypothetical protein